MRRAGAEAPAARGAIGFVMEDQRFRGAARVHLEAVIRTIGGGLAESERIDEEALLLGGVLHREDRSVESAQRDVRADLVRRPAGSPIARVLDHFEEQAGRMPEANVVLAEPLLNPTVLDLVTIQMVHPERRRALRGRECRRRDLARSDAAGDAPVRKRRQHRANLGVRVGVVQMIVSVAAVEQDRLLDQALAEDFRDEVDVLLRAAGAQRDVMNPRDRHGCLRNQKINFAANWIWRAVPASVVILPTVGLIAPPPFGV